MSPLRTMKSPTTHRVQQHQYMAWAGWEEWQMTGLQLFSADREERRLGLKRIATWRARCKVPLAVEATGQLVEIMLNESLWSYDVGCSARSEHELRMMYSMALTRTINGLVDPSQKGNYAVSISTLANQIGIPLWLVDLRHQATHNELPSLPTLRMAADHLLEWLRNQYWLEQSFVINGPRDLLTEELSKYTEQWKMLASDIEKETFDKLMSGAKSVVAKVGSVRGIRDVLIPMLLDKPRAGNEPLPIFFSTINQAFASQLLCFLPLLYHMQLLWSCSIAAFTSSLLDLREALARSGYGEHNDEEVMSVLLWVSFLMSSEWWDLAHKTVSQPELLVSILATMEKASNLDAKSLSQQYINTMLPKKVLNTMGFAPSPSLSALMRSDRIGSERQIFCDIGRNAFDLDFPTEILEKLNHWECIGDGQPMTPIGDISHDTAALCLPSHLDITATTAIVMNANHNTNTAERQQESKVDIQVEQAALPHGLRALRLSSSYVASRANSQESIQIW